MASYTAIVVRESGYRAGWFATIEEAEAFAIVCNREVPSDPARAELLDPDGAWEAFCKSEGI